MADGRKNNGGRRKGAGRPKATEEQKAINGSREAIASVYGSIEDFWIHAAKESKKDFRYFKVIAEYAFGKPVETIKHQGDAEHPMQYEVKLRKDDLESDAID